MARLVSALDHLTHLEALIAPLPSLLVAYSGGVDSAVLLAVAHRVLGDRCLGVTADSPSIPREELAAAAKLAREIGARHRIVTTRELEIDAYRQNDRMRCYWCKHTLFSTCGDVAREEGIESIAYGFTADDVGDYRPGQQAAGEFGILTPLRDAALGKDEIRVIASHLGLPIWDKPAAPCLASRIPYGSEVTMQKLAQIETVEELLREKGFRVFRARFDGTLMRIEVEASEIPRLVAPETRAAILARAKDAGVPLVTIDLEGFESGKLNRESLA
ncbi:MAG: ATP-dependent sacrificial sulfur transferase LarE [Thermoanaerobaculia bacterium]